jgi:8-oxo-dGTP pyrophosphatase MutT (NUDIX family)
MKSFPHRLQQEIRKGLPGTDVQWQMASTDRRMMKIPRNAGADARQASVLMLLFPAGDSVHTLFMQRPEYDGVHSGQISFPGGKSEPSDADAVATAYREASEETGIDPGLVELLGVLTPLFIPVSNMVVTPVVAWASEKPSFRHHEDEVAFLFEGDLRSFVNEPLIKEKPFPVRGAMISVRYFDYEGHVIWGATAMMLNELLELIRRSGLFPAE